MKTSLQYGIFEHVETVRRVPFGRWWDIDLLATPVAWLNPFVWFAFQMILSLRDPGLSLNERLYQALIFAISVEVATVVHVLGHIFSGKMVHSSMDELLITATRDVNTYHGDQTVYPGYVHIARAIGGPILNLLVAGSLAVSAGSIAPGFWADLVSSVVFVNCVFGFGGFLPLPSVDGIVIWREILRPIRDRFRN